MPNLAIKALTKTGVSPIHGETQYSLPTQAEGKWIPGEWQRVTGPVKYRANGFHVCMAGNLPYWKGLLRRIRPGLQIKLWVVEYRGNMSIGTNGFAVRECRVLYPYRKNMNLDP